MRGAGKHDHAERHTLLLRFSTEPTWYPSADIVHAFTYLKPSTFARYSRIASSTRLFKKCILSIFFSRSQRSATREVFYNPSKGALIMAVNNSTASSSSSSSSSLSDLTSEPRLGPRPIQSRRLHCPAQRLRESKHGDRRQRPRAMHWQYRACGAARLPRPLFLRRSDRRQQGGSSQCVSFRYHGGGNVGS